VVSAGVCGALAPELAVGALVVPETVLGPDGGRQATAAAGGLRRQGTLLTADRILEDAAAKSRLWLATGALAVDMESAPILAWAAARGWPAAVVRGVSDPAGRGVPADLARVVQDGRVRPMRAVSAVLARPRALADALALRAGTAAALRSVAGALGALARAL
jgi:nucleoside phosphorylase